MKKSSYDTRPPVLTQHSNGVAIFRWDIVEVIITDTMNNEERTSFDCYEVWVNDANEKKVIEVAIDAMWGDGVEQKLQNDYNAAKEGIFTGAKATKCIADYKAFLNEREALKLAVKTAYNE